MSKSLISNFQTQDIKLPTHNNVSNYKSWPELLKYYIQIYLNCSLHRFSHNHNINQYNPSNIKTIRLFAQYNHKHLNENIFFGEIHFIPLLNTNIEKSLALFW